jgi:hypothetical protein
MAAITVTKNDFASESSHWYTKTGEPAYTVIGANGKVRNTTLADARKLDLVPSVTTIASVEAKPQLTQWLVQQGMMACLTLPRLAGEDEQTFMARALDDSKQQVRAAADRGTYLHGLLEKSVSIMALHKDCTVEDEEYILPILNWLNDNFPGYTWSVERSFAHRKLKYGGKVDLHGTHETLPSVVLDYKCKDFDDPKKKLAYDEHCSQLTAYAEGLFGDPIETRLFNIFVSSTKPGLFIVKEWDEDEKTYGWRSFRAMIDLWQARKKFT